jgi:outer membrane protein assembly factor BamD (BamD/ComL family)
MRRKNFLRHAMLSFIALIMASWAWGAPAEIELQEAQAREYLFQITRAPSSEVNEREALYLRLIGECPATEAAEEAHWALSNLYLDDMDEPQEEKAREILEKFLERYPTSQWAFHVKNRLAWLRGESGER